MNKNYTFLATVWVLMILTFSYALFSNYALFLSDKLGFLAISIATLIGVKKPKTLPKVLFLILSLGAFNILSFVYFINYIISFGMPTLISPGIQVYSVVLLIILSRLNPGMVSNLIRFMLATTKEDFKERSDSEKNVFLARFQKMNTQQLESKLEEDLSKEARLAVEEILKARNSKT